MPQRQAVPTSDPTRRALRTLFQVGTITALIQLYNMFSDRPLNAEQVSAVTAVGAILIAFVQNYLEDAGAVPAMLKGKPDPSLRSGQALDDRKLDALAAAVGSQHADIERLEQALLDLRNDIGSWRVDPDVP